MPGDEIQVEDPRTADVRALLERHLAFANQHTPAHDIHAFDVDALLDPAITFFTYRRDGRLLAVGALKRLDADHVEVKSMHTAQAARRTGVGAALLEHLIGVARQRGFRRISLETGSSAPFAPARSLYARAGFVPGQRFGDYPPSAFSFFMTKSLAAD